MMDLGRFSTRLPLLVLLLGLWFCPSALAAGIPTEVVHREGFVTATVHLVADRATTPWPRSSASTTTALESWLIRSNPGARQSLPELTVRLPEGLSTAKVTIKRDAGKVLVAEGEVSSSPIRLRLATGMSRDVQPFQYEVTDGNGVRLARWSGIGGFTDQPMNRYRGNLLADTDALFDSYWKRARKEVDAVDPAAVVVRLPDRDTSGGLFHRVEIQSTEGATIVGWFIVPRQGGGPFPAILILPGYGAEEPASDRTADGFATLALSPRGHGPSKAFGWKARGEMLLHNIQEPERYFYLRAVQDAIQGVRFLDSHSSISLVGVEGGSQGGMLALGAAALCPKEVSAVASNVPCFSDYGSSLKTALSGPHQSLREYRASATGDQLMLSNASLGLTDGAALAARIRQPLQVVMGSLDVISPVLSGYAIINQARSAEKSLVILADEGHALPLSMQKRNREWFRRHLLQKSR